MSKWYKTDLIRGLVDMHIPNGEGMLERFDAAVYAENMKRAGADAVYVNAQSCLGYRYYPSSCGLIHRVAERDQFGSAIRECKKRGLHVIAYTNSWNSYILDLHPEWSAVYSDGSTMWEHDRFGNPCINNPEYKKYMLAHIKELCEGYELDGVWVDMVGIWAPVCHCNVCRESYYIKTGRPLPSVVDLDSADFMEYFRYKGDLVAEYVSSIRSTALAARPGISVAFQSAGFRDAMRRGMNDLRFYECCDYLAGDFYTDRDGVNVVGRALYRLCNDPPFEFMTSRCSVLEVHTMNKSFGELLTQAYASVMLGGSFLFIDAIDPSGEMDSRFYDGMARISEKIKPLGRFIDREDSPMRDIAVYFNFESSIDPAEQGACVDRMDATYCYGELKKIARAFSEAGLDYDVITKKNIAELSRYRTIVLSDLQCLGADECDAIREYIKEGGSAYISGVTSMRDCFGNRYESFALSDVIGARAQGRFDVKPNYISPRIADTDIFGAYNERYPHMLEESFIRLVPDEDTETLASVTLPISDCSDIRRFSSALSNPPMVRTEYPAIIRHRFGKGRVIYSAGVPERDALKDNRRLFTALIRQLIGRPRAELIAPECVDCTVYEGKDALKIHLLNVQSLPMPLPVPSLCVSAELSGRLPVRVYDSDGEEIPFTVEEGRLVIECSLEHYRLIIAELK